MAVKSWNYLVVLKGVASSTVLLDPGDTSNDLELPNFPDKTIHVFATGFGDSTVSVLGSNNATATFLPLHRTDDPTSNYSTLSANILGHILENPQYIRASATGATGTGITVTIVAATPRG